MYLPRLMRFFKPASVIVLLGTIVFLFFYSSPVASAQTINISLNPSSVPYFSTTTITFSSTGMTASSCVVGNEYTGGVYLTGVANGTVNSGQPSTTTVQMVFFCNDTLGVQHSTTATLTVGPDPPSP